MAVELLHRVVDVDLIAQQRAEHVARELPELPEQRGQLVRRPLGVQLVPVPCHVAQQAVDHLAAVPHLRPAGQLVHLSFHREPGAQPARGGTSLVAHKLLTV